MKRVPLFILILSIIYITSCIEPNIEGSIGGAGELSIAEKSALYEVLSYAFAPVMARLQDDHLLLLAAGEESGTGAGSRYRLSRKGSSGELILSGVSGNNPYSLRIDTLFNNFVLEESSLPLHIEGMGKVEVTPIPAGETDNRVRSYRIIYRGAVDIIEGNRIKQSVPWEITVEADLTDIKSPRISREIKICDTPFYPGQ